VSQLLIVLWILVTTHILVTWVTAVRRGRQARQRETTHRVTATIDFPPVSVIVPAWNEKGTIERCIQSLKNINYPVWEAIILAGGKDGTYQTTLEETEGDARFTILERGPEPKNEVINRGIEIARDQIIVILDADSIVEPTWLRALVEPLLSGAVASYGFYLPIKKTWISIYEYIVQISYIIHKVYVSPGCASMAIRKDILNNIGPLTTNAYSWEDWDVSARIITRGGQFIPAPRAKLLSDRPASFKEFWDVNMRAFRTHLAGLWHHRKLITKQPLWAINDMFFLFYGSALSILIISGIITIFIKPTLLPLIGNLEVLLVFWLSGRRAAIVAEAASFTGENKWLKWFWAPIILLFVQIPATLIAIITVHRQPSFDYKGRREESLR
jgi:cellulose synthase/poly-beta-1,6-N-acetylglucosamine synthase-like glycosyltransferase